MVSASWQRRKSETGWDLERHFVTDISILVTCFLNSWKINYTNNRPSQVHISQQKESKKKTQFTSKENILTTKMINTKKYKTRKYTQVMIHWQRFPCSFMESCDLWYLCTCLCFWRPDSVESHVCFTWTLLFYWRTEKLNPTRDVLAQVIQLAKLLLK